MQIAGCVNFVPQLVVGGLIVSSKRKSRKEKGGPVWHVWEQGEPTVFATSAFICLAMKIKENK